MAAKKKAEEETPAARGRQDVTVATIAEEYMAGASVVDLADKHSCSPGTIKRRLAEAEVEIRKPEPKPESEGKKRRKKVTPQADDTPVAHCPKCDEEVTPFGPNAQCPKCKSKTEPIED